MDVSVGNMRFWAVVIVSVRSAAALQGGWAVHRAGAFGSDQTPLHSPADWRLQATHLPDLLNAIASADDEATAAALMAACFTDRVEYEDMLAGVKAAGVRHTVAALRHHPQMLSNTLPRQLLGVNLPRLTVAIESTAATAEEAVVEWQVQTLIEADEPQWSSMSP